MVRRTLWMAAALLTLGTAAAFAYGPLFPWSVVKPGYQTIRSARAEVSWPHRVPLDPAYLHVDQMVAEAEAFQGMRAPDLLRIVECANWGDFRRFCPIVPGRGVGAVTLDLGGVIYISPRVGERGLDKGEFVRHEIAHAIVAHNVPLWNLQRMKHHTWLYEGVPVWFARQRAYLTRDEFLERAGAVDLQAVVAYDANSGTAAPVEMRFAYVAWRYFLEYLVSVYGRPAFDRFYHQYLGEPDGLERLFEKGFGKPLRTSVDEFQTALRTQEFLPGE
jgi:hypothetical protein